MTSSNAGEQSIAPRQIEQFEIEPEQSEEELVYPKGMELWLTMTSLFTAYFLNGLDLTIVAVAVPSLTDEFKTLDDIGWYSAAYGLTLSAFIFFFGKVYTVFSIKSVFITGLIAFELGSALCTFAPTSHVFIIGRALAGLGSSAIGAGSFKLLRACFPLSKQALMGGLTGGAQSVGLVAAPVIGGALIDAFSWRACFGINLPLGILCIVFTYLGFQDPVVNPDAGLPLWEKVKRIQPLSVALVVPGIACLLMGLQWGGVKYGWQDTRIIVLFVSFSVLIGIFGYVQYRQGDSATIPLRILKKRSILAGMWYSGCCNGVMAMTEYYISIYFQGVRGFTATKSALLGLPMIAGFMIGALSAGVGTTIVGYYYPFMFATSILAPIASGLLITLNLDEQVIKVSLLLAFLGFAIGLGMQAPQVAVQAVLPIKDVSIGGAIVIFGGGMGSALWICASATLFQNRLSEELAGLGSNISAQQHGGLSGLRSEIGSENLKVVLSGYNDALVQTLYMPLALGAATIIGSIAMERRSIKKKQ